MPSRFAPPRPRATTLLVLATLAVVAALTARGVADLASSLLLAPSPPRAARVAVAARAAPDPCALLARNAFDSTTGSLACDPPIDDGPTICPPDQELPACPATLRLVAVYLRRDAGSSLALVARDTQPSMVLGVGGALDDAVLTRIDAEAVELTRGELTCRLALFAAPASDVALARTVSSIPPLEGVRLDLDRDRASIDRSVIERILSSPPSALRTVRARPALDSAGRPALRLSGIRRDHPLAGLGLESGDLLLAVDGRGLGDPDAWLEALAIARAPGRHTVEVERAGARRTVTVEIVDR